MTQTRKSFTPQTYVGWLLLILLAAVSLRLFALPHIPPGLTHDEAAHGMTAAAILEGSHAVYFTIGHGREPLYDYLTAAVMAGIGPTALAGRLTAVYSSLLLIAGMAAWSQRAFDRRTAVLTAAGLALGFWPLMAARQSLRSITLPALLVLALLFFWRGWQNNRRPWRDFLLAGLFLGLTFYTYIPARALWLLFPLTVAYAWLIARPLARRAGRGLLATLIIAGLIGLPLFLFLQANPEAEIRIRELSGPLRHPAQLRQNIAGGLAIFTFRGDDFWRYNIPGRPLLGPVMGLLFGIGLIWAGWLALRPFWRRPGDPWQSVAGFLALAWLLIGLAPVLITGPSLSMTQAMGLQPALYLFPALALGWVGRRLEPWGAGGGLWRLGVGLLFAATAVVTANAYFQNWAQAPPVRVQYESAMTAVMGYLNQADLRHVAVSTITPGQYHTPALAALTLRPDTAVPRWFDGRNSLLIPNAEAAAVIFSGFAPLAEALQPYWPATEAITLPQPASDPDRPLTLVRLDAADWLAAHEAGFTPPADPTFFGRAAQFLGYDLQPAAISSGDTLNLITLWRVGEPTPGLRQFTHLSGAGGMPLAQADGLGAASGAWVAGDLLLQWHSLTPPPETTGGQYSLTIGLYTCLDAACTQTERLPALVNGRETGDHLSLQTVTVTP